MRWDLFNKPDDSSTLAKMLDKFEATRPSRAIETFVRQLTKAFTQDVPPENREIDDDAFTSFTTAKSLEKLLLLLEWQRACGQKGLDRHIQTTEAQLMPLYDKIVSSANPRLLFSDVAQEELESAIADLTIANNADLISDAHALLKKTKEEIRTIVSSKQRGA